MHLSRRTVVEVGRAFQSSGVFSGATKDEITRMRTAYQAHLDGG
jgi:hypothetical protein